MVVLNFAYIKCACGKILANENVRSVTHYTGDGLRSLFHAVCPECGVRHYLGDDSELIVFSDDILQSFPQGVKKLVENFTR